MKRNGGRAPQRIPTPDELADAPESALLHALDESLDRVPRALVAAHPEFGDPEAPFWVRETSRSAREAEKIVATAYRLQQHIRAYRTAITLARDQRFTIDPKTPF